MSFRMKVAITLGALVLASLGVALLLSHYLVDGMVRVEVDEGGPGGDHVAITLPASWIQMAVQLAPEAAFRGCDKEARTWIPVIRAACQHLPDGGDFELVSVRSPRERVSIRTLGGNLLIRVDSDEERVRVQMPLGLADHVLRKIASLHGSETTATLGLASWIVGCGRGACCVSTGS